MRKPLIIDEKQLENVTSKAQSKASPQQQQVADNSKKAPVSKVLASTSEKWTVPNLADNFDLDKAKAQALKNASSYMNNVLNYDDLHVEMVWDEEKPMGHVKDMNTGKLVNSYEGVDLLKVYSQNQKERGIIVDGRV
ncbi:MAG: hypothetical protein ACI9TY_001213 [Alphaproteobacteria bacterium]|jgi:hypothetical protein